MMETYWWWFLIAAGVASGLALWPRWLARTLSPAQALVLTHGAIGGLLLASLALLYRRDGAWSNTEVIAVTVLIASGAMLFGARHKRGEFPRLVMALHAFASLALVALAVSA